MPKKLKYQVGSDTEWNVTAAGTASVEVRPSEKNPEEIIVTGPCPRCSDLTMHIEPVIVFSGLVGDPGAPARDAIREAMIRAAAKVRERDVEVICACGTIHDGAPDGRAGCGASWVLHVEWDV